MRDIGAAVQHRIKGRPALVRSLRSLLIRVHRFGKGRARTHEDVLWTARTVDVLSAALRTADPGSLPPGIH